jgi:hypothetical protein
MTPALMHNMEHTKFMFQNIFTPLLHFSIAVAENSINISGDSFTPK